MNNTDSLLLNPKTRHQAELFLRRPAISLLITGPEGSNKLQLARLIAHSALGLQENRSIDDYPFFLNIKRPSDKKEISIDAVRQIRQFLALKVPGGQAVRRAILIENAETLSREAQNALLKMLEEPNLDALFILAAHSRSALLPTIVSRCQIIPVHPIPLTQAAEFYGYRKELEPAWRLSGGQAVLLDSLLNEAQDHPLSASISEAKDFLRLNRYERLLALDRLSKDKVEYEQFLGALAKVLAALHQAAIAKDNRSQAARLLEGRKLLNQCQEALTRNVSHRLINLYLALNLSV